MTAERLLDFLLVNKATVSARFLHRELEIRQPYQLWISRRIVRNHCYRQPDDFMFVMTDDGKDCELSPTSAIVAATGGGSQKAAKLQVMYCRLIADVVFADRDVMEVFDTALKCGQADELLQRSFDPEPDVKA